MSILDCYKEIIATFDFGLTDESFFLTRSPLGSETPTTIGGKRLVLPTKEILRKGLGDDYIAFHPLSESMAREATSEVQKRLQKQAKAIVAHRLVTITNELMELVADSSKHKKVPIKQSDFLKELSGLDKSCAKTITRILNAAVKNNKLVTIYLKSSGVINGTKMNRVTTIHFPFINEINNGTDSVCGIKTPKKHLAVAKKLFEILLPNGGDHNEYSVGSNSRVAPYFTSFVLSYHRVIERLNELIKRFGKFTDSKLQPLPLFDVTIVDSFGKLHDKIPPQRGNIGGVEDEESVEELAPWEEAPVKAKPVVETKVKESDTISPDDFFKSMRAPQPQYQQPQFQPQMQMQSNVGWNNNFQMQQPVNPFNQAVQQQQMQNQFQPQMQMQQQGQWNPQLTAQVMQMQQQPQQMGFNQMGYNQMGFNQMGLGL